MTDQQKIRVRVGQREMALDEARRAMDQTIVTRLQGQHPNANSQQGAQAFVDAYMREHEQAHGQPFTGSTQQQPMGTGNTGGLAGGGQQPR